MPEIRLPDGSSKSFPGPVTVAEVAQSIGAGLAKAALAGKVNGRLVDTDYRTQIRVAARVSFMKKCGDPALFLFVAMESRPYA